MISAILLAAGTSSRMGTANKLLLPYHGKALVHHMHDIVVEAGFDEVITVLGHEANLVQAVLQNQTTRFVHNSDFKQGMTSSIQTGVKACHPQTDGFMIFLSDLVLLKTEDIKQLIFAFQQHYLPSNPLILVPTYQGKHGHPVCFSRHFKDAILQHQAPNGCKEIVQAHWNELVKFELNTAAILKDVDTPEDFREILGI